MMTKLEKAARSQDKEKQEKEVDKKRRRRRRRGDEFENYRSKLSRISLEPLKRYSMLNPYFKMIYDKEQCRIRL